MSFSGRRGQHRTYMFDAVGGPASGRCGASSLQRGAIDSSRHVDGRLRETEVLLPRCKRSQCIEPRIVDEANALQRCGNDSLRQLLSRQCEEGVLEWLDVL